MIPIQLKKMNSTDIQELKNSGSSGMSIIKSLIQNSDTFASKTAFSQQKWIKRKRMKYCRQFRVIKATPQSLCQVYHHKGALKIGNLRWDALAQILSFGGVYAGAKVLVFETVIGLIVGSCAYRMRGHGKITALYPGQQPHYVLVPVLNLDDASMSIIEPVSSSELYPADQYIRTHGFLIPGATTTVPGTDSGESPPAAAEPGDSAVDMDPSPAAVGRGEDTIVSAPATATATVIQSETAAVDAHKDSGADEVSGEEGGEEVECAAVSGGNTNIRKPKPRYHNSGRQPHEIVRNQRLLREGFTSFIMSCKFHPLAIMKSALVLLLPSSPFVLHCEYMEPLIDCYVYLQTNNIAIKLILSDTWLREYQVLPGRYHPMMNMTTSGGYLLTGIYLGAPII